MIRSKGVRASAVALVLGVAGALIAYAVGREETNQPPGGAETPAKGGLEPSPLPEHRLALLIGISGYKDTALEAEYPARDVRALKAKLMDLNFKKDEIITLVSPKPPKEGDPPAPEGEIPATKENIRKQVEDLSKKLPKEGPSLLIVYVAAHGSIYYDGSGATPIIKPADYDKANAQATWLSQTSLIKDIESASGGKKVIILEVCQTPDGPGPFPKPESQMTDQEKKEAAAKLAADAEKEANELKASHTLLIRATSDLKQAFGGGKIPKGPDVGKQVDGSYFATYFLRGLQREGRSNDKIVLSKALQFAIWSLENTGVQNPKAVPKEFHTSGNWDGEWDFAMGTPKGMSVTGADIKDKEGKVAPEKVKALAAKLEGVNRGTLEPGATFTEIELSELKGQVDFGNRDAAGALTRAKFKKCNLSGLDFTGADLSFAVFEDCNLEGTKFGLGTDLTGAKFISPKVNKDTTFHEAVLVLINDSNKVMDGLQKDKKVTVESK